MPASLTSFDHLVGAAGNVGMQSALNSAPDGYTIAFVGPNYAINPALYEKLPFDFIRDSVPVAGIMRLANVMEVNPALPDLYQKLASIAA